jgi:hypothetical protein
VDSDPTPSTASRRHDLADEERIALGLLVDCRDQPCRSELRRCQLDVLRDLALAQPGKRHPTGDRLARDLGQRLGERPSGDRINVAVGGEQEDAGRAKLTGEEPQQQQRGRVGRVKIVQDEHRRRSLGDVAKEVGGRVA